MIAFRHVARAIGALVFLVTMGAVAQTATQVDVTNLGAGCPPGVVSAIPNDGIDDTPAFSCAIGKVQAGGGIVTVPSGTFEIRAQLILPPGVVLEGQGTGGQHSYSPGKGTILHQAFASYSGTMFLMLDQSAIRHVEFTQDHPTPAFGWTPNAYDSAVLLANGVDIAIEDVMFYPANRAIEISGTNTAIGRVRLDNVRGEVFSVGIKIDNAVGGVRVQDVHFWPYWSIDSADPDSVSTFTQSHAVGVLSLRDDQPMFSHVFMFGMSLCMNFSASTCSGGVCGATSSAKVTQLGCDHGDEGIRVDGPAATKGLLIDEYLYGGHDGLGLALRLSSSGSTAVIGNLNADAVGGPVVRIEASNCTASVFHASVRDWNTSLGGYPAFQIVSGVGNYLWVNKSFASGGHGAAVCGFAGQQGVCGVVTGATL